MAISWDKSYSVNVKELDEQHQYFISLLNKAYQLVYQGEETEKVSQLVKEIIEYAKIHFSTEEKYFDQFNYQGSEEHKKEHQKITTEIFEFYNKLAIEADFAVEELIDFLEDWLVKHLNDQDKKYTECFNKNGLF